MLLLRRPISSRRLSAPLRTASVILVAALVLTACSGDDRESADPDPTTTTALPAGSTTTDVPAATTTAPGPTSSAPETGPVSVIDLGVGDCFDAAAPTTDPTEVVQVSLVDCGTAHDSEVFAQTAYESADRTYPGEDELVDYATRFCVDAFEPFVGLPYAGSAYTVSHFWPTIAAWDETDDRTILCTLFLKEGQITGTAKDSGL